MVAESSTPQAPALQVLPSYGELSPRYRERDYVSMTVIDDEPARERPVIRRRADETTLVFPCYGRHCPLFDEVNNTVATFNSQMERTNHQTVNNCGLGRDYYYCN